jgi:hypothetical protein
MYSKTYKWGSGMTSFTNVVVEIYHRASTAKSDLPGFLRAQKNVSQKISTTVKIKPIKV